jgi:hypothetical protein
MSDPRPYQHGFVATRVPQLEIILQGEARAHDGARVEENRLGRQGTEFKRS